MRRRGSNLRRLCVVRESDGFAFMGICCMPKVDVIVPAYNAARYLKAAIESVETQTFDDWRILLVDDGSTDNTAEVVAPYVERLGPKLKYIRQANRGVPGGRNG